VKKILLTLVPVLLATASLVVAASLAPRFLAVSNATPTVRPCPTRELVSGITRVPVTPRVVWAQGYTATVAFITGTPPTPDLQMLATRRAVEATHEALVSLADDHAEATRVARMTALGPCDPGTPNPTLEAIPHVATTAVHGPVHFSTVYVVTVQGTIVLLRTPPPSSTVTMPP
jgi:hypothetical protein